MIPMRPSYVLVVVGLSLSLLVTLACPPVPLPEKSTLSVNTITQTPPTSIKSSFPCFGSSTPATPRSPEESRSPSPKAAPSIFQNLVNPESTCTESPFEVGLVQSPAPKHVSASQAPSSLVDSICQSSVHVSSAQPPTPTGVSVSASAPLRSSNSSQLASARSPSSDEPIQAPAAKPFSAPRGTDPVHVSTQQFNVLNYGAVGDGKTDDSKSFLNAWTAACGTSNAEVYVPAGYKFKVYPTTFTGPCQSNFGFKVDGTLQAPKDPAVWSSVGRYWLYFKKVSITVEGPGTFDGQGQQWWANSCKTNASNPCVDGPTALVFDACAGVTLKNLAVINSQQMHVAFEKCSQVHVSDVRVISPGTSPNTDGIHLQNSSSVTIENSILQTGDDCISVQTGSFNVRMTNVSCGPGHGISVGGLGKNKARAEVANMVVDGATFTGATNGVRLKSWQGSTGYANGLTFQNIRMDNCKNPLVIDQYYCDSEKSGSCPNYTSNVVISDVTYNNIHGTSANDPSVSIHCSETVPCTGLTLKDIKLVQTSGSAATASCVNAHGSASGTMLPASCLA